MGPKDRGRGVKANSISNSNSGSRRIVVPNIAAAASRILAPKWADTKYFSKFFNNKKCLEKSFFRVRVPDFSVGCTLVYT